MIRRLLEWFFPFLRVQTLLERARVHGRVTLQEVEFENGIGWQCSIRPPVPPENIRKRTTVKKHEARYAWTGTSFFLKEAVSEALAEAEENPVMTKLAGIPFTPKLGGKEFDDG